MNPAYKQGQRKNDQANERYTFRVSNLIDIYTDGTSTLSAGGYAKDQK